MKSFRQKVFKIAHEIRKSTGKNFSVCLSKAWRIYRLTKRMTVEAVTFSFEKKDGSLRKVQGSLMSVSGKINGKGKQNHKTVCYWDTNANRFGSFKVENLISIF